MQRTNPQSFEFENRYRQTNATQETAQASADAAGYWFAVAAVVAFIIAGIIVYRVGAGSSEIRTAANDGPAIAAPQLPPPIHVHVEGIDP